MPNGTIPEENKSVLKEVIALLFLVVGSAMTIWGLWIWLGRGAVLTLCGLLLAGLGVRLGLSRTGKE